MSTAIGITLGALAILVSILLHEVGHMTAARALGKIGRASCRERV